ncbi:MAG: sulfatase-like hydrolase/transferase [Candidatus Marsarchaeota archaeon]|jgi:predicted AlkP superfamily pyrophosphatase or phosphodiesterase|nr:sulfatase-like hydrolase/transferase [Candidatus Marsarchaeota archaeon]MCL5419243.1 sulfatase-like hydrolase/transferase [Candidatus Marsarchaeota archaeon]
MKGGKPNIAIIVLDSVRYDAFGEAFNHMKSSFSKLGKFTALGNCIAPASWTLPSHASLFTGMYPSEHGAHETKSIKALDIDGIKLRRDTLIDDLAALGYKTYGISANPYVHPVYGFTGFDKFKEESYFTDMHGYAIEVPERLKPLLAKYRERYGGSFFKIGFAMLRDDPALITELANLPLVGALTLKNLAKKARAKVIEGWPLEKGGKNALQSFESFNARSPFFLFLNLMEAHEPYIGKKGMDFDWPTPFLKEQPGSALIAAWKRKYRVGIEKALQYAYGLSKRIVESYPNSVVIITSDHGQEFGEHGFIGHGVRLDDELVHVPFIVRLPEHMDAIEKDVYSSLVNVRSFVNAAAAAKRDSMARLYSNEVYAESFGIQASIENLKRLGKELDWKKLKSLDRYQKRTFRA